MLHLQTTEVMHFYLSRIFLKHHKGFPHYKNPFDKGDLIIQFLVEDLVGRDYEQYLSNVDKIRELLGKPENDIEYGEDECETVTCIDYIDELHRPNNTAGLVRFSKLFYGIS